MSDIPMDVVADILSRLPVKPLIRFRCVSKPWYALIDSSGFVKLHLKRSKETNTNRSLILKSDKLYSVDLDSLDHAVELGHPFNYKGFDIDVLGSCDGLLCLYDPFYSAHFVLWNPSTRKLHNLPTSRFEFSGNPCSLSGFLFVYGFGYDAVYDDYKVVKMVQYYGKDDHLLDRELKDFREVKVYSMKSNSWRRVKDFPYYLSKYQISGVFISGALHWVVNQRSESPSCMAALIASFDIGSEEYGLVPMPEFSDKNFYMTLIDLGICLCVFCEYVSHADVWVMKEYGVEESWTKLLSIAKGGEIMSFHHRMPVAYSNSGKEVILRQDGAELLLYDFEKEKVKKIKIPGLPRFGSTHLCLGSLVPLHGVGALCGVGGSDEKNQQSQKKSKKKGRMSLCSCLNYLNC
ncbi:F-box protein CPR1-like [Cornus florida]|uniref:F-box protein CPR1-like n=1 Tax=Cornus florida TaxID=4283 RepID=UPI00289874E6|nr:F-box protein CPR1-like [Cornus florida]XP_059632198.1 F-box protein CPR1-like [Cornus florida]